MTAEAKVETVETAAIELKRSPVPFPFQLIGTLSPVITVSLIASLFLSVPAQTKELYRYFAEITLLLVTDEMNAIYNIFPTVGLIFSGLFGWAPPEDAALSAVQPERRAYVVTVAGFFSIALLTLVLFDCARRLVSRDPFLADRTSRAARVAIGIAVMITALAPAAALTCGFLDALRISASAQNGLEPSIQNQEWASPVRDMFSMVPQPHRGFFDTLRTQSNIAQPFGNALIALSAVILGTLALLRFAGDALGAVFFKSRSKNEDRARAAAIARLTVFGALSILIYSVLAAFTMRDSQFAIVSPMVYRNISQFSILEVISSAALGGLGVIGVLGFIAIVWRSARPLTGAVARVLGFTAPVALFWLIWLTFSATGTPDPTVFSGLALAICVSAALLYAVSWALTMVGRAAAIPFRKQPAQLQPESRRTGPVIRRGLVVVTLFAMIAVSVLAPVEPAQWLGALAIFCLFAAVLCVVATEVSLIGARRGLPAIALVFSAALVFGFFDLNENHLLHAVDQSGAPASPRDAFVDACEGWDPSKGDLHARCDARLHFTRWLTKLSEENAAGRVPPQDQAPLPVFLIAAQGGGAYAAAHTLFFLSEAQRACPTFLQHVFAISSVSGGSVGAALLAGLQETQPLTPGPCAAPGGTVYDAAREADGTLAAFLSERNAAKETAVRRAMALEMASQDLLSPLFGATFFPDAVQRFIPYPVASLSRARGLERAIAASWESARRNTVERLRSQAAFAAKGPGPDNRALDVEDRHREEMRRVAAALEDIEENPLDAPFLRHWDPDRGFPALLFNATETATGIRRVIAPFRFGDGTDIAFFPLSEKTDLTLARAAVVSARFPYLTPAASFQTAPSSCNEGEDCRLIRLVDGGYADNSGTATIMDLVHHIGDEIEAFAAKGRPIEVTIIALERPFDPRSAANRYGEFWGELMSPVRGILSTRGIRSGIEIERARDDIELLNNAASKSGGRVSYRFRSASIDSWLSELPLGWTLSDFSLNQIIAQAGAAELAQKCSAYGPAMHDAVTLVFGPSCLQEEIREALDAF